MSETFTYDNNRDIRTFVDRFKFDKKDFENIFFNCEYYETRISWGHRGEVRIPTRCSGVARRSIRYYNRTWEEYTYQTLLMNLLDDYATYLTDIDYHKVLYLNTNELYDFKTMKRKDFMSKYGWCSVMYRETKKHLQRIGEIQ